MSNHLQSFIEEIKEIKSIETLSSLFSNGIKEYGYDNFVLGTLKKNRTFKPKCLDIRNFPLEWVRRYFKKGYQNIDPILENGLKQSTPFKWSEALMMLPNLSERQNKLMEEALDFGLNNGFAIPIINSNGEKNLMSVSTASIPENEIDKTKHFIHVMSVYFFETYKKILENKQYH